MSDQPELFDRRVKARSLAYVFTAGAALGLLTLAFPHDSRINEPALFVLAGVAVGVAALFLWRAPWTSDLELHAAVAVGTVIITVALYEVHTTSLYPIIYTWTALQAFTFFQLRWALAHVVLIAALYAVLLTIQDPMSPVVLWLLAVGTPTVVGLLVSRLLERLQGAAASAAERAGALARSETRLRTVLDSAPNAFVAIDSSGKVSIWNVAAERMFGWRAEETLGRPLRELIFPPEGRGEHDERRARLLAAEEPRMWVETELQRRDGSRFPVEETLTRFELGDELMLSAFIRDVSDRRRREEEREALQREQNARAEAERVAEMIGGMQVLVDAALSHRALDDMVTELAPLVRDVLIAGAASIFLVDEEQRLELAASTAGTPLEQFEPVPAGRGFAGRVAAERTPLLIEDPSATDLLDPGLRELEIHSLLGVPMMAGGRVTGVIVVAASPPRRFREEELALLQLASDRVALAIEHARVYEREHRIAETLQRSLLPERLPQLPGLAVAARYLPAASEAEVGGDWYDVIAIPGGGIGLVMGDVAGKGLAAASMVGRLRSALRAYALEGHPPAAAVEQLNRLVWTEADDSQMATLMYVVLDPAEATLCWVNAGHLPPMVIVGEGLPHYLEGGRSVPLGVLPFPGFEAVEVAIEPGASVVLYTDGLVERPGVHLDQALEHLAQVVKDAPGEPEALCDHVLSAMVPERGAPDDVALLVLRSVPMADDFSVELPTAPEALASMRSLLRRWLHHAEGSDQEIAEITTACGEAATNAIEHAGSVGRTPFEVVGRLHGRQVEITVRDRGAWRDPRDDDQGRGLSLMRALMDDVQVDPGPKGTIVRLRRRLDGDTADNGAARE
ncbi:MAG: SpoIIE family protein phosphatase [Thermoleophilaceae bacterium]